MPDIRFQSICLTLSLFVFLNLLLLYPAYADKIDKETSKAGKLKRDFAVTSMTLDPDLPVTGGTFTAAVTVTNLGTIPGDAGRLDVWLDQPSAQPCGAGGDIFTDVGELEAGKSRTVTFTGLPSGYAGEKTFRAFVDDTCQTAEPSEPNNQFTLPYNVVAPDFVVTSIVLAPASPTADGMLSATVTVKNQGTASGDAGQLNIWPDQNTTQPCGASVDKSTDVGVLAAGESRVVTFTGIPAGYPGEKMFRACVDSTCRTTESSESNNQSVLSYTVVAPDFVVTSIIISPLAPAEDGMFDVFVTVKNQGDASGDAGRLDVWLDQPATQPCGTAGDKSTEVGVLAPGNSTTVGFYVQAGNIAGNKTLNTYIDSSCGTLEHNESNNQLTLQYSVLPLDLQLGKVTAATATSFRIVIVQNTPPPGFEDRFYISESWFDTEPDRAPDKTVTGPAEYVDFTGLTPGRIYFVQAWRHVNGVTVKASRVPDRNGNVSITNHYHGYTLSDIFTPFTGPVWTEDWTEPFGVNWYGTPCLSIMNADVRPDDGLMGGAFLRIIGHADFDAEINGVPLRSRAVCKPGTPITVEGTIRFNEDWASFAWGAVCLYTSESEYCGFTRQSGQGGAFQFYETGEWFPFPNQVVPVSGRVYRYRYDYDGNRGITAYLDGVVQGTFTLDTPFSAPFGLWLGLGCDGEASVDYGPITITGGDFNVWGFTDNACVMMDLTGATGETGREIRGKNLFTSGGGLTAQEGRGDIMSHPYYELIWNYYTVRYRAGIFTGKSPLILPAAGYRFKDLCLIGSIRAGGSLKAYVRDKYNALIPDEMLPGNSDGFSPIEGSVRTIDLSGVQAEGLVIELVGDNPNDWTTAPPIWKAAWVDFQPL